jgi:hypothetical protein
MTTIVGQTNRHPWLRLGFVAVGWIAAAAAASITQEESTMKLTSVAWMEGKPIPVKYTCDGADVSPPLAWSDAPAGTRSFALICDDPDAPAGTWVHWVIYGLPATATALSEGIATTETLPDGAKQGVNDFRRTGYGGPCPPPGAPHRYYFKLYALDATPALKSRATKVELLRAMAGHILAEARLMGTYQRAL